MESAFKIWETSRNLYLGFLEKYTLEQLNKVPEGFSNNLIWNIGHIIVAQQGLVYKSSGLPGYVPDELFALYKPGTRPTGTTSEEEVAELKELLISLIAQTKTDYYAGKFVTYNARMTGTGFQVASLTDAIQFNNYHEALHLGVMMGIRKFV
ncbi:DinB family protein [Pontibacter litorisediminis]|uniref:DinB family protein n=1 Tax=Pontibacter litorisediminis TaxID=1846260 RepID=UPI0023EDEFDB|nr:DinB family protein [Pontibacter litorisediminis]